MQIVAKNAGQNANALAGAPAPHSGGVAVPPPDYGRKIMAMALQDAPAETLLSIAEAAGEAGDAPLLLNIVRILVERLKGTHS